MKRKAFQGLTFTIDRPKGYVKEWPQKDGSMKSFTYPVDYGYLPRHTGEDNEGLDFFVGDDPDGHLESFQKLRRNEEGKLALDETKFLVGVTDAERETIYRLYGNEVWHRKVYRNMDALKKDLPKFRASRKPRYKDTKEAQMLSLTEKQAINFGRVGGAVQGLFSRFRGRTTTMPSAPMPHAAPSMAPHPALAPTLPGPVNPFARTLASPVSPGPAHPFPTPSAPAAAPVPSSPMPGPTHPLSPALLPKQRDTDVIGKTQYVSQGLGGILANYSPEGRFLRKDPAFRNLFHPEHIEHLDALAHHLLAHQQSGGRIDPDSAYAILQSPQYHQTVQHMKTSEIRRQAKIAVLARYGFKQADAKFADIDKKIMGEIEVTGPNPMDWAFSRMTGPQLNAGAETTSSPGMDR